MKKERNIFLESESLGQMKIFLETSVVVLLECRLWTQEVCEWTGMPI